MTFPFTDDHLNESILKFVKDDYVRIQLDQTIGQALASVQQTKPSGRIVYFYVLDEENRLCGIVPTRRLLLNPPETPVREVMVTQVISLSSSATLLDACEMFLFHRLLALPVLDDDRKLQGIVDVELYTEEISDLARATENADIFQLIGVHVSDMKQASTAVIFRNRFPWLLCNVAGGLACAVIAGLYEGLLADVVALSLFIPVVLALAESVSIQSLTLTLQAQHGKQPRLRDLLSSASREVPVGLMLGLACGTLVAVAALAWQGNTKVALSLLLSIAATITLATLFGLLVPMTLRFFSRDPKVASGPITLAMTDLATLFTYLGLATWLLQ